MQFLSFYLFFAFNWLSYQVNFPAISVHRLQMINRRAVHLHAQFSRITAIVWLCYSIRQPQLSEYIWRWENWFTGWSVSYPGTIGDTVVISTSANRDTSGWPLYVTSCLGIRERWRTKSEEKLHLCTFHLVYMIITQTRCTVALLLAVISEERRHRRCHSTSGSRSQEKNLEPAQNAKSESNLMQRIHIEVIIGVIQLSIE